MAEAETFGTFQRVYLGFRITAADKRVYAWVDRDHMPDDGVVDSYYAEKKLAVPGAVVGGIYTFTYAKAEQTAVYVAGPHGPAFAGMLPNKATVAALQAAHQAAYRAYAAQQEQRKAAQEDYIEQFLAPLRRIYQDASPYQQRAIEILVLDHLRRK